ncbi:P-loop NTPase fold protein [Streptomyces sp. CFMR 7]|uniref:P-loop NTPase fold protein n=1 Tax=Streptomyces sp. CFMR 7 TaxID=1649184 RepID=UPI0011A97419|nr:P-loop NTPase fold protein [Streptomyces sp. CFMR 7]
MPLPSSARRWAGWAWDFHDADVELIYQRCVLACLEVPRNARLLGHRPRATRDAVMEQMRRIEVMDRTLPVASRAVLESAIEDRDRHRERFHQAHRQYSWVAVSLSLVALLTLAAAVFGLVGLLAAVFVLAVFAGGPRARGGPAGLYVAGCLRAVWLCLRWGIARLSLGIESARWGETTWRRIEPAVWRTTRALLGDDPDSLLVSDSFDGLRSSRNRAYRIDNAALQTLTRKLSHMDSGTIAVCGPRGAGKSTLLETTVDRADFGLLAQAPASYTPHEFLLSLSVELCEKYMRHHGHTVPPLVQLSPLKRFLRRARSRVAQLLKWAAFALPAAAAVALGVGAAVRKSVDEHVPFLQEARRFTEERIDDAAGIWQGHAAAGTGVTIALLGVTWWRARNSEWIRDVARGAWRAVASVAGIALIVTALIGVERDVWIAQHLETAIAVAAAPIIIAGLLWLLFSAAADFTPQFEVRGWEIRPRVLLGILAGLTGWAGLLYTLRAPGMEGVLASPQNALHLTELITGVLLLQVRHWAPKPAERHLVTRCRSHLFRLQAQLSASTALTAATPQFLTLGTSHTTSVATLPPNFPEVVQEFRDLLARIAAEFEERDQSVVIAIDELDRLGTDTHVLAFLAEIKAIFGVEHVHYVLAVAEDVGAAFVRRGLPHRDVTDSSLDDIVHVQPATLEESRALLDKRAELTGPYALLTHTLAGGIPRDLIRYGRRIMDMKDKTRSGELVRIARLLILEELSETLAGFRTLLSKQQWTPDTGNVLNSFRTLVALLREPCPCTESELHSALQQFAFYQTGNAGQAPGQELADEARQLIDEASAYTYFSLTLLDIFAEDGLERRTRQAAQRGPDGNPERLAHARQELAVSPYSSRPLIEAIRKAWSLPMSPSNVIRWPWERECLIHGS